MPAAPCGTWRNTAVAWHAGSGAAPRRSWRRPAAAAPASTCPSPDGTPASARGAGPRASCGPPPATACPIPPPSPPGPPSVRPTTFLQQFQARAARPGRAATGAGAFGKRSWGNLLFSGANDGRIDVPVREQPVAILVGEAQIMERVAVVDQVNLAAAQLQFSF